MNKSIFNDIFYKAYGRYPDFQGNPELEKFADCIVRDVIEKAWYAVQWMWSPTDADFVTEDLLKRYGIEE